MASRNGKEQKKKATRMDSTKRSEPNIDAGQHTLSSAAVPDAQVSNQHTPGPWVLTVSPDDGVREITAPSSPDDDSLMCDLRFYPWCPTNDADWRLIAAAPDLLAALKLGMCPVCDQYHVAPPANPPCSFCAKQRAAIAKAEGR